MTAHSSSWLSFYHCHLQKGFFFLASYLEIPWGSPVLPWWWCVAWLWRQICREETCARRLSLWNWSCQNPHLEQNRLHSFNGSLVKFELWFCFCLFVPLFCLSETLLSLHLKRRDMFKACTFIALLERKKPPRICHNKVQINITCTTYLIIFFYNLATVYL